MLPKKTIQERFFFFFPHLKVLLQKTVPLFFNEKRACAYFNKSVKADITILILESAYSGVKSTSKHAIRKLKRTIQNHNYRKHTHKRQHKKLNKLQLPRSQNCTKKKNKKKLKLNQKKTSRHWSHLSDLPSSSKRRKQCSLLTTFTYLLSVLTSGSLSLKLLIKTLTSSLDSSSSLFRPLLLLGRVQTQHIPVLGRVLRLRGMCRWVKL